MVRCIRIVGGGEPTEERSYRTVGKSVTRVEAVAKATGEAKFTADISLPHTLTGAILGSPLPHARILKLDTSRAAKVKGVKAIVTGSDCENALLGLMIQDKPPLAKDKVRFYGEYVAAVAAADFDIAQEAIELIQVEYEELPAVFDPHDALRPDAPLIHEGLPNYVSNVRSPRYGNVCAHAKVHRGNVEQSLASADYVYEDAFSTQSQHQGYIETHAAVASVDASGKVTLWAANKGAFGVREGVARVLGLPLSRVRVIVPAVGGDFGGKGSLTVEPLCALLAAKAGRPVRLELDRKQDFYTAYPRHPISARLRVGARNDGTIVAIQGEWLVDAGAYADTSPRMASKCSGLQGPYRVDNISLDGRSVYTNKLGFGNCRAPGTPQACFAIDSAIDAIAEKLGIDPLEMRLRNILHEGDLSATGQVLRELAAEETLRAAARNHSWGQTEKKPGHGKGLAIAQWQSGSSPSGAIVRVNEDGTAAFMTGAVEQGGGCHTILAQIVAESLGVSVEEVSIVAADTDATPIEGGTGGSRTTFTVGRSAKLAAEDARRQLLAVAASLLEAGESDMEVANRTAYVKGSPDRSVSFAQIVAANASGPIIGRGTLDRPRLPFDASASEGHAMPSAYGHTFASQVVDVEVDRETGDVKVLGVTVAQDVGFAINPMAVEGQIEGGVAMGLGFALSEELLFDGGRPSNPTLADYRMPRATDMPPIHETIIEKACEEGPYGAKGAGESTIVPTAAAIANAIYDAVGVRIKSLPVTPEVVRRALRDKTTQSSE